MSNKMTELMDRREDDIENEENMEGELKEDDEVKEDDEAEHVIFDLSSSRRNTVISIQPHLKDAEESRIPIPITVTSGLTSENRYVIRNGDQENGDSLFGCCETSASWQRLLCGARRKLHLTLLDQTHQEAATFHRRLASSIPQLGIYLQRMDVYLPGGEYLGSVEQEWSPGYPNFTVRDSKRDVLYKIRANNCWTCSQIDFVFYILNAEDNEVLSHISHEWDRDLVDYNLSVLLPPTQSVKSKALIIAAVFLFEYMYFLPGKEAGCLKSCCK